MPKEKTAIEKIEDIAVAVEETRALAEKAMDASGNIPGDLEERFVQIADDLVPLNNEVVAIQQAAANAEKDREEIRKENEAILERCDKLDTRYMELLAMGSSDGNGNDEQSLEHRGAMQDYFRNHMRGKQAREFMAREDMAEINQRALSEGVAVDGGFLVQPEYEAEIIKNVINKSPVSQVARTTQLSSTNELKIPVRNGVPSGYWVGEEAEPAATQASYKMLTIPVNICGAKTVATTALLQDASFIENEMSMDAAEAIAVKINQGFLNGDGVEKPFGIMTDAAVPVLTGADTSTWLIGADDFYTLLFGNSTTTGLQAEYRDNATFAFNSVLLSKVMKLKASGSGEYIWHAGLGSGAGAPPTVAGRPYIIFEHLDNDGVDGNKPVICADFFSGYRIVRRTGMWVIRDPYSTKPNVEFDWFERVGGAVSKTEAIRILTLT